MVDAYFTQGSTEGARRNENSFASYVLLSVK